MGQNPGAGVRPLETITVAMVTRVTGALGSDPFKPWVKTQGTEAKAPWLKWLEHPSGKQAVGSFI